MQVKFGDRLVGGGAPTLVIAEAGVNHNGDVAIAHRLVEAAANAGADAVKFQAFRADELVTPAAEKASYQQQTTGAQGNQYDMLSVLQLSADEQAALKTHCESLGILYLCTPYEAASVDMLDALDVAGFKIASTDTTNTPLLRHVASKGRPTILSTGMSTLEEVEQAVSVMTAAGLEGKFVLLHCTSEYPAPRGEANLRAIPTMQQLFGCPVGYSDHTEGIETSAWAVAIGADVIEKHMTLDRRMAGPDHRTSLEPEEMAHLVRTIRNVHMALGDGVKRPMPSELANIPAMRKSLVARRRIGAGEVIRVDDLTCKRPGTGLSPSWLDRVADKRAAVDIEPADILTLASIRWTP